MINHVSYVQVTSNGHGVLTVGDLRAFLAECDEARLSDRATVKQKVPGDGALINLGTLRAAEDVQA